MIISADAKNGELGHYSNLGKKRCAGPLQLNGQRKRRAGTNRYEVADDVAIYELMPKPKLKLNTSFKFRLIYVFYLA